MNKPTRMFLTPKWVEIKNIFDTNTNGSKEYLTNFEQGGELDIKSQAFIEILGELTRKLGPHAVVEDVKLDLWKERIWSLIENAGLLAPIAWKVELQDKEVNKRVEELEKEWYNELDEFEINEDEESIKKLVLDSGFEFNEIENDII